MCDLKFTKYNSVFSIDEVKLHSLEWRKFKYEKFNIGVGFNYKQLIKLQLRLPNKFKYDLL